MYSFKSLCKCILNQRCMHAGYTYVYVRKIQVKKKELIIKAKLVSYSCAKHQVILVDLKELAKIAKIKLH